jgi:hypothetical protein
MSKLLLDGDVKAVLVIGNVEANDACCLLVLSQQCHAGLMYCACAMICPISRADTCGLLPHARLSSSADMLLLQVMSNMGCLLQVFDSSLGDVEGGWWGPDEEFGIFAAVHGPPGTEFEDQALLAVNLGEHGILSYSARHTASCLFETHPGPVVMACKPHVVLMHVHNPWLLSTTMCATDIVADLVNSHCDAVPNSLPSCIICCCSCNLAGLRSTSKHAPVVVYTSITRSQLELLRDVPGGDERRLGVLTGELGVKLVGRPLDGHGLRLLEAIVQHRGLQDDSEDADGVGDDEL